MSRADTEAAKLLQSVVSAGPPINVDKMAKTLGVVVIEEALDPEVSGVLYRRPNAIIIAANRTHSPTRRRFTVAHELGHLILHQGRPVIVDHGVRARINFRDSHSSLATEREEIEANRFAANVLMPASLVHLHLTKELSRKVNEEEIIDELARRFGVSPQAIEFRLTNLGLRAAV